MTLLASDITAHVVELRQYFSPMLMRSLGSTYKQISTELNIPIGTVRSRIHRGTKILNILVEKSET